MARTDNFTNFATDVANSIREMTGKTNKIPASEFDTEITSIAKGEDLTEELTDYNTKLATQESVLKEIVIALENKSGVSSDSPLNIFIQDYEPSDKEGIWVKTNLNYKDIKLFSGGTKSIYWNSTSETNYPINIREAGTTTIDNNIYLFGGLTTNATTLNTVYKYNVHTKEYTQLENLPYAAYGVATVSLGTDIYIFGGRSTGTITYNSAYKYDTVKNTYTQLSDIPYSVGQLGIAIINTDIYLIGGTVGSTQTTNMYKYDTLTDTYTQLTNMPIKRNAMGICTQATDIYIFGGYNGNPLSSVYKYNTINDSYIQLSDMPYVAYGFGCIRLNNNIYIFGGTIGSGGVNYCYVYNIITDTYVPIQPMPVGAARISVGVVNNDIYIFGGMKTGAEYITTVQKLTVDVPIIHSEYDTIILCFNMIGSEVIISSIGNTNVTCNALNGYYYSSIKDTAEEITTYHGDGIEWVEFKD